jgi:hypothetical protein
MSVDRKVAVPEGGVPEGKLGMLDLIVKKDHDQKIADIIAPWHHCTTAR